MDKAVHYCCVAAKGKGGRIIQAYNSGGDLEIEKLAALCLESAPPYHRWYSQTMGKKTYCFLMEDGIIYFAIADGGLGNPELLRLLEHVRNEFKKIARKERGSGLNLNLKGSGSLPILSSSGCLQLITSLQQHMSQIGNRDLVPPSSPSHCDTDGYGELEAATSSKAPLLGKTTCCKNAKDHIIGMPMPMAMRGIDKEASESDNLGLGVTVAVSPTPLQKDIGGSMAMRSSPQSVRKKWCRLLRLVLVIDAAVCILLFLVWLVICQGLQCIR